MIHGMSSLNLYGPYKSIEIDETYQNSIFLLNLEQDLRKDLLHYFID